METKTCDICGKDYPTSNGHCNNCAEPCIICGAYGEHDKGCCADKPQHTPTPFWIDEDNFIASGSGDNYRTIAEVIHAESDVDPKANAAFIVKAVNSHDELVTACNKALIKMNVYLPDHYEMIRILQEALKNAE